MTVTRCNVCGKEFDIEDYANGIALTVADGYVGYGSSHDGELFRCDLCTKCFDGITGAIEFKINPFAESGEEVWIP